MNRDVFARAVLVKALEQNAKTHQTVLDASLAKLTPEAARFIKTIIGIQDTTDIAAAKHAPLPRVE